MKITVRPRNVECGPELEQQVQRSVMFAVDRYSDRLNRVSVYLTDLNGPRGGVDKLCHLVADMKSGTPVLIVEKGEDILSMVNRAARRLGYRLSRRMNRLKVPAARHERATVRAAG
jgi:hypothetical protein